MTTTLPNSEVKECKRCKGDGFLLLISKKNQAKFSFKCPCPKGETCPFKFPLFRIEWEERFEPL